MRARVRAFLPDRTPVIIIVGNATDVYDAAAKARTQIIEEGQEHLLSKLDGLGVTEMEPAKKGAVYIGKTPSTNGKRGRAATPAVPVPTQADKDKAETIQAVKSTTRKDTATAAK